MIVASETQHLVVLCGFAGFQSDPQSKRRVYFHMVLLSAQHFVNTGIGYIYESNNLSQFIHIWITKCQLYSPHCYIAGSSLIDLRAVFILVFAPNYVFCPEVLFEIIQQKLWECT